MTIFTLQGIGSTRHKTSTSNTFPVKLHQMVEDAEQNDFSDIVSWNNVGSSFKVHKPTEFSDKILPAYFKQIKYKSFQRQLNLYGFVRTHQGCHRGSYSHKLFRRGEPKLSLRLHHKPLFAHPAHYLSSGVSMSVFDVQTIRDFEAPPICESIVETLLEPTFDASHFSECKLCEDVLDTDVTNIAFDAENGLNDISNHPLFHSNTIMEDPKLLLKMERILSSPDLIADFVDFQEKESEMKVSGVVSESEPSFPWKLHDMLEAAESNSFSHIVSWEPDGVSFKVHRSDEFVTKIMPLYFDQTKYESFRKQLNLYNFSRVARGSNIGMLSHASFVKEDRSLCKEVKRHR
jgi:hypothetical protein